MNITDIVTPIQVEELKKLLLESGYDRDKSNYLIQGFTDGFDIGYRGPKTRQDTSMNLPIKEGVGSKTELWNKVMKEVKHCRYAGPFESIPFENYMQSPIGLVPKDNGKQTRLIFHLSYDFKSGNKSLNYHTPEELSRVKYRDLDHAVANCLQLISRLGGSGTTLFYAKTDVRSAFRLVLLLPGQFCWLVMKAQDPQTGQTFYFVDRCLPFGASRSCAIFQAFSDGLAHILQYLVKKHNFLTNYLDDFLFIATLKLMCDYLVAEFP